jgi:hypothetical protein
MTTALAVRPLLSALRTKVRHRAMTEKCQHATSPLRKASIVVRCVSGRFAHRLGNGWRTEAPITRAGQLFADPLLFWQGLTGGRELRS